MDEIEERVKQIKSEISKLEDELSALLIISGSSFVEFGCSYPVSFITSEGIKTMQPNKSYDQNLNEI